jgi:putative acetyltransferase
MKLMNILNVNDGEKETISSFFNHVFSQSEGPAEGAILQKLTFELTDQINDNSITGFKSINDNHEVMGCIFFTKLHFFEDVNAYLLAPVGVHPFHHQKGIGTKLIEYGVSYLNSMNVDFLMTYGDPNYYSRFGFQGVSEQTLPAPFPLSQPEGWLVRPIHLQSISKLSGPTICVEPFNRKELW